MKPKILFDRYISRKNFYQSISEADPNLNKFKSVVKTPSGEPEVGSGNFTVEK